MSSLFISYSSADSLFVLALAAQLKPSFDRVFCYDEHQKTGPLLARVQEELAGCGYFAFVVGARTAASIWQIEEASTAQRTQMRCVTLCLPGPGGQALAVPDKTAFLANHACLAIGHAGACERELAAWICRSLDVPWKGRDGLPAEPDLFGYEKDIIAAYAALAEMGGREGQAISDVLRDKLLGGMPLHWPDITRVAAAAPHPNPLVPKFGRARSESAYVVVSALYDRDQSSSPPRFGLPEAGPRADVRLHTGGDGVHLQVAVLVVGGIAPGINAVIDGIVSRQFQYAQADGYPALLRVDGLLNGLHAFDGARLATMPLVPVAGGPALPPGALPTTRHAHEGGSMLGTSRDDLLLQGPGREDRLDHVVRQLDGYHAIYVIGGDGGMRLAHAIDTCATEPAVLQRRATFGTGRLRVVGVPKTMDNDILWVWQAFGFLSAVGKAREIVELMYAEVESNPRLGIVQLFGSVSGFVVSHAVLAGPSRDCDIALVPEAPFTIRSLVQHLKRRMLTHGSVPRGLVVMAETALPMDTDQVLLDLQQAAGGRSVLTDGEAQEVAKFMRIRAEGHTLSGQTSDELRSACLKIVGRGLMHYLKSLATEDQRWDKLRIVTNEPRHVIRAIAPSAQDIIMGRRLGTLAVDNIVGGYTDFMISQWLTEFVLVPLPLVVLGRKQIHRDGIFWKSVLSKTDSHGVFEG